MLVKVDIEKDYDTLSWDTIIATLIKMKFPSNWGSYVRTCLNSISFSLLMYGNPTSWLQPVRGVRQGDPLSPYLFILVAKNLTAILNYARNLDLILGFSGSLNHNFDHLMYADDLILVTTASRKSARNICFYLNLYAQLSGQKPNQNKLEVFFISWFNRKVSSSICSILNFKHGKTPFTYLVFLISHKQLAISHFSSMIDRLNVVVANWGKANMSKVGKVVLINSVLMAAPIYYLSMYPILDSILTRISQIARKFLWANCENGRGISLVNWNTVTANKTEVGMGI